MTCENCDARFDPVVTRWRYPNNFQNLLIGAGLQYRDEDFLVQNGVGARVAPSYTPTGFKVYEFVGGTGNIEF